MQPGAVLADRYRVVRLLGRGGMGSVYLAEDPVLEREVAVKVLNTSDVDVQVQERFRREAMAAARLDHPAVVGVYDFGHHEDAPFFVMPYVAGDNLRQLMRKGSLRLGDVLEIGIQVARALDHSHKRQVVHRDIKPANIIVGHDDAGALRLRITDFGVARLTTDERMTRARSLLGTIRYLSPEQARGEPGDGRADVYALATVLYECLAGQTPFNGAPYVVLYQIIHEPPQDLREVGASIDRELAEVVLRCLDKDPERRPATAGQLARALELIRQRLAAGEREQLVAAAHDPAQARGARSSDLIGREHELEALRRAADALDQGEGGLVVIGGPPGTGRTSLLEHLARLAAARGLPVQWARFLADTEALPYQVFLDLVQGALRQGLQGAGASALADLAPDLLALFPALDENIEIRAAAAAGGPARDHGGDPTSIHELLAKTVARIAGKGPLVILLEDLNAAGVALDALQYVLRRLGGAPILVAVTFAPDLAADSPCQRFLRSFEGDRRTTRLSLKPLAPALHRTLLEQVIGSPNLDPDLVERLYEVTEGNPGFTRELVRSLLDSGEISGEQRLFVLNGPQVLAAHRLPATIRQAVERRIAALPAELGDVLAAAAVLGPRFATAELAALCPAGIDVDDACDRLVGAGLVEDIRSLGGDSLAFTSALVRDVLYDGLPRRRRRLLHRRCGEVVEARAGHRLDAVYPRLVHHFGLAGAADKVVRYGLALARRELELLAGDKALRAARTVLEVLAESPDAGAAEAGARAAAAEALRLVGDLAAAAVELELAAALHAAAGDTSAQVEVVWLSADTAWRARDVDQARRFVDQGLRLARAGEHTELRARFLSLGATLANLRGDHATAEGYLRESTALVPDYHHRAVPAGGTLVVALAGSIEASHPALIRFSEDEEALVNVFEPLLAKNDDGVLVPHLATAWTVVDGGRRVDLELRPAVLFHDGSELTAAAVMNAFEASIRTSADTLCPAFAALTGLLPFLAGEAEHLAGITVLGRHRLSLSLASPMPIFPSLLTDSRSSVAVVGRDGRLAGTGPFALADIAPERALLRRFPAYWQGAPRLDAVELRSLNGSDEVAEGLRAGDIDVAWGLRPDTIETLMREPRFRKGLAEVPRTTIFFLLFNLANERGRSCDVRAALGGVLRTADLVRRTLGTLARPADGFLPPGVLGHHPGPPRLPLPLDQARALIERAGLAGARVKAAVHPIFLDRYLALTEAILAVWAELGVEVAIRTSTMEELLAQGRGEPDIDLYLVRWAAEYDDPDSFFSGLFHSGHGRFAGACATADLDLAVDQARVTSDPEARAAAYRVMEQRLLGSGTVVPLFHEIASCVVSPRVEGLRLHTHPPYVSYRTVGKRADDTTPSSPTGGVVTVPLAVTLSSLDPADYREDAWQVTSAVFETLTRQAKGARIVPWLAAEVRAEQGHRRFAISLRTDISFHDGRPLTSDDVRFSFERLLRDPASSARWMLAAIRGADEVIAGTTATPAGLIVVSAHQLVVELEQPAPFFPAQLTAVGIVPASSDAFTGSWRDGCVGTGPFRVRRFEPGRRIELEANPLYWLEGYPRADALVFDLGLATEEIVSGFWGGRYSVVWGLSPAVMDTLVAEAPQPPTRREIPRLSTYFLALNRRSGPLAERALRDAVTQAVDPADLVRRTLGRYAVAAGQLTPPDLLACTPPPRARRHPRPASAARVSLRVMTLPVFRGPYREVALELFDRLAARGFGVELLPQPHEGPHSFADVQPDLVLTRWFADYPDADSFAHGVLHSTQGAVGPLAGSAAIDALIERVRSSADGGERAELFREIESRVAAEAVIVPLFHEQECRLARPEVRGFELRQADPVVPYEKLWIER